MNIFRLKFVMKKFSNKTTRMKGRTRTMLAMANWNWTSLAVYAVKKKPNAWNVESNWVIFLAFSLCCCSSPCVRTTACMYKYRFDFGMHLCSRQIWLHHTSDEGAAAAVPAIAWQSTTGFLPFSRELKHRRSRDDADDDNDHFQHEEQKLPHFLPSTRLLRIQSFVSLLSNHFQLTTSFTFSLGSADAPVTRDAW